MNEQDEFLKDLTTDQKPAALDVMDMPLDADPNKVEGQTEDTTTTTDDTTTVTTDNDDEDGGRTIAGIRPRNRKERRRLERLVADGESATDLARRLATVTEVKAATTEESDFIKGVERIYGNATPEAQMATDLLKKAFVGVQAQAKAEALAEVRAERQREKEAEVKAARELDDILDDIEDTYDVNLTEPQEKAFFGLLQKMSPKNEAGQVEKLADPHAVWEIFQDKLKKKEPDTRAKNLSSRSMVKSGGTKDTTLADDTATRFLLDNGLI